MIRILLLFIGLILGSMPFSVMADDVLGGGSSNPEDSTCGEGIPFDPSSGLMCCAWPDGEQNFPRTYDPSEYDCCGYYEGEPGHAENWEVPTDLHLMNCDSGYEWSHEKCRCVPSCQYNACCDGTPYNTNENYCYTNFGSGITDLGHYYLLSNPNMGGVVISSELGYYVLVPSGTGGFEPSTCSCSGGTGSSSSSGGENPCADCLTGGSNCPCTLGSTCSCCPSGTLYAGGGKCARCIQMGPNSYTDAVYGANQPCCLPEYQTQGNMVGY